MLTKLLILIAVVLLAGFALRAYMPKFGSSAAFGLAQTEDENKLGDCPNTPNCQGSESSRASQQVDRIVIEGDPGKAMETLVNIVSAQATAALVKQEGAYVHFTFTTPALQFVDDVEMLISDDQQSLQIRSASRLGKSDLGANEKRIAALRSVLAGKL